MDIPLHTGRVVVCRNQSGVISCHVLATSAMIHISPDGSIVIRIPKTKTILTIDAEGNVKPEVTVQV